MICYFIDCVIPPGKDKEQCISAPARACLGQANTLLVSIVPENSRARRTLCGIVYGLICCIYLKNCISSFRVVADSDPTPKPGKNVAIELSCTCDDAFKFWTNGKKIRGKLDVKVK